MASKGVPSKVIARPPPIVVEPPNIDLTVEEDMVDDTKEWDSLDGPSIPTSKGEFDQEHLQSDAKGDMAYLVTLPKEDLFKLSLVLWRPAEHGHMLASVHDLVAQLENKHGCRLHATRGCLPKLISSLSSLPQSFEHQLSLTKPPPQPLPKPKTSGLPKQK